MTLRSTKTVTAAIRVFWLSKKRWLVEAKRQCNDPDRRRGEKLLLGSGSRDAGRLASGGARWPAGVSKSLLGGGFYAWGTTAQAEAYMGLLESRGATGLFTCSDSEARK